MSKDEPTRCSLCGKEIGISLLMYLPHKDEFVDLCNACDIHLSDYYGAVYGV